MTITAQKCLEGKNEKKNKIKSEKKATDRGFSYLGIVNWALRETNNTSSSILT